MGLCVIGLQEIGLPIAVRTFLPPVDYVEVQV